MTERWPDKDPQDKADYQIDWYTGRDDKPGQLQLDADTIASSTWTVPSGLTGSNESHTTTVTTIWLAGGTAQVTYEVVNHIVTAAGREWDQTVKLRVKSK